MTFREMLDSLLISLAIYTDLEEYSDENRHRANSLH